MKTYRIHLDGSGDCFEVCGEDDADCRRKADEECAQRNWSVMQVWSERVGLADPARG